MACLFKVVFLANFFISRLYNPEDNAYIKSNPILPTK